MRPTTRKYVFAEVGRGGRYLIHRSFVPNRYAFLIFFLLLLYYRDDFRAA